MLKTVIYEVRLTIALDIRVQFMDWLEAHVQEMLTFDGFVSAKILTAPSETFEEVTVLYQLDSRSAFSAYEAKHAQRMRAEGLSHFPNGLKAERRLWDAVECQRL